MVYQDNKILTEKEYQIMKNSYDKIHIQEIDDLRDILNKMTEQREKLTHNNTQGLYDNLIKKMSANILDINNIINSTNRKSGYKLNTNSDDAISPIRSKNEIESHNNSRPQSPKTSTTSKRGRPMQNSIFSIFFEKFNIKKKKSAISQEFVYPQMRYHNIMVQKNECNDRKSLHTHQIDIIRLLLLYIALKPQCPYISRLTTITSDQFDILLHLE